MEYRELGNTGLKLSSLSFGASSLGQEFRQVDIGDAMQCVHVALDLGMNFIDTSPFYGRGMSEVLLGVALRDVPRDKYYLGAKLGRYDLAHFDFSAKRVIESVDVSLHRMGQEYLDIILCHDIEFVDMVQIVEETLPALTKLKDQGKVRFVGVSGYPMKMFKYVLDRADLDVIMSYNHYTLQNTMLADLVPTLKEKGVGCINAAPFSARLLTNAPLPSWHKATEEVKTICKQAATSRFTTIAPSPRPPCKATAHCCCTWTIAPWRHFETARSSPSSTACPTNDMKRAYGSTMYQPIQKAVSLQACGIWVEMSASSIASTPI